MFCPGCGEEIYLREKIIEVESVICENCNEKHTIRNNGQASTEEVTNAQRKFQGQYEDNRKSMFEKSENIVNRVISENIDRSLITTEMKNPQRDRNVEAPGDIRART